jgi:AraC-like DNA-binding protein
LKLNLSFFEVLILIGVSQGFVISALIWLDRKRSISKVLLSFVLTVFNLLCIKILILTTGLWQMQWLRYLPLAFELAIQPLILLYTASLILPNFKLTKRHLFHFVPFAISIAYSLFIYIVVAAQKEPAAKDAIANSFYFNTIKKAEDYLSIISSIVYWSLGLRLVLNYRRWLYNNTSNTGYPTYTWLKNISASMGILITILTIDIILDSFFHFTYFFHWQFFFIYLAALIYYLGFRGYNLPNKLTVLEHKEYQHEKLTVPDGYIEHQIDTSLLPEKIEAQSAKPTREIKLSDTKRLEVENAIKNAFEVKALYLDPELNLQKLANEINTPVAIVSIVINSNYKKSFRNLVNEYRVEKVKHRLADPKSAQFSILGIAYESGFNSEASFFRIFKTIVGISPKEYAKQLKLSE